MPYRVYAALRSDISSGWVWIGGYNGPQRSIVKVKNKNNRKSVYCEALKIDDNFLKDYRSGNTLEFQAVDNALVINEWYRHKLGIEKNADEHLSISLADHLVGRIFASVQHPQVVVRIATWLALLSVVLGGVGLFLGIKTSST